MPSDVTSASVLRETPLAYKHYQARGINHLNSPGTPGRSGVHVVEGPFLTQEGDKTRNAVGRLLYTVNNYYWPCLKSSSMLRGEGELSNIATKVTTLSSLTRCSVRVCREGT